ncbi:MAG: hypothetical protein Q8K05_08925 [Polaromonas sp.]|jgi:hypothetical protein|uniref:hypothetical protein n=1 Tax=Polaromonas sp. TaxID=1869339 RepID=UPI00272F8AB4|nr:hypothetical protein [Polaromonas sp.]MDP2256161.1 hypothetical protein [Polaromonas sp.]MDP3709319.1 hypothetical protein [Polaromonas sp.]
MVSFLKISFYALRRREPETHMALRSDRRQRWQKPNVGRPANSGLIFLKHYNHNYS